MTKYEFLAAMQNALSPLRVPERMEHCSFYEELINDMVEDGYTEEEATARLGDPAELAEGILREEGAPTQSGDPTAHQSSAAPPSPNAPPSPAAPRSLLGALSDFMQNLHGLQGKNISFHWSSEPRDRFERQIPAEGIHALDIRCVSGDVEISVEDRDTILLAEERYSEDSPMTVEVRDGCLFISMHPVGVDVDNDLDVILPMTLARHLTSCGVTTVSGDVNIEELCAASLRVQSQSGDIGISDVDAADAEVRCTSGDIEYGGNTVNLSLHSVSGDVTYSGTAQTVYVNTVSGDMEFSLENCPSRLRGVSTSGDLDIELPPDSVCAVQFHSLSGDLSVRGIRTGGDAPSEFSIKTVSGDANIHT